jgi:hypothetical protein
MFGASRLHQRPGWHLGAASLGQLGRASAN